VHGVQQGFNVKTGASLGGGDNLCFIATSATAMVPDGLATDAGGGHSSRAAGRSASAAGERAGVGNQTAPAACIALYGQCLGPDDDNSGSCCPGAYCDVTSPGYYGQCISSGGDDSPSDGDDDPSSGDDSGGGGGGTRAEWWQATVSTMSGSGLYFADTLRMLSLVFQAGLFDPPAVAAAA